MSINSRDFCVKPGSKVDLDKWPTRVAPFYASKKEYKQQRDAHIKAIRNHQKMFYAFDRHSLLLIFQAMDAAGKDGAIKHVMSGVNPQGCQVFSFKKPSAQEIDHDFLWRTTRSLPERGRIGIFNRSYYEEVLVVRVHPEILGFQKLPPTLVDPKTIWQQRYESIVDLEKHLHRNGTRVVKFFLHLSEEEQRQRFLARIDNPDKNWKFSEADVTERAFWPQYMQAYAECLSATSTEAAPWYVVPADDKKNARLIIGKIIEDTFASFDMQFPQVDDARRAELLAIRKQLIKQEG